MLQEDYANELELQDSEEVDLDLEFVRAENSTRR